MLIAGIPIRIEACFHVGRNLQYPCPTSIIVVAVPAPGSYHTFGMDLRGAPPFFKQSGFASFGLFPVPAPLLAGGFTVVCAEG